ncbi:MAG: ABC transporter permease [Planctomycetaceae bacterium]|nr:ABC transporter permease [Planctomycetaceae bacterium]
MTTYLVRRLLYNIPIYLGIIFLVMAALRVNDPVYQFLGKNATEEQIEAKREAMGLTKPFLAQYGLFLGQVVTLHFSEESWDYPGFEVGELLSEAIGPSLAITVPALILTTILSIMVAMLSAWYRGRWADKSLMFLSVLGMSISFLVYIIIGQYLGAFQLPALTGQDIFAIHGYAVSHDTSTLEYALHIWPRYCLLPVLINVIVAMGYDTRFYRAVMVEESGREYITTAMAKGVSRTRIMFLHMLKNAMIPIITRVVITLPFLITGSFLVETFFGIPGMGLRLIMAVEHNDFPVIQAFTAVFAALYIGSNLLTDVLYALVDPRVRLS